jgi:hypothetical protein
LSNCIREISQRTARWLHNEEELIGDGAVGDRITLQDAYSDPDFLSNYGEGPAVIEDCSDPEEAESIAQHYRSIIATIRQQLEEDK